MRGACFSLYTCFMRESDRIFLETLRAGVGSTVDESTWGLVEKQVAESGVRGLTGSARMVVESLVAKHGGSSHNQKTHAAGGGGGGGESSSGGSKGGSGGKGSVGTDDPPGKPMGLTQAADKVKTLRRNEAVNASQVLNADMREATVNSPNLPKGSKATVLATGIEAGGERFAYVAFSKPTTYTFGDNKNVSDVHLVSESELSFSD